MSCTRGAAHPNEATKLRLFGAAAGHCQNPCCLDRLFYQAAGKSFHIAEMAHIFAAEDYGPRANTALTREDRGRFENIILLCPSCHTKVDKVPAFYTDAMILGWKRDHQRKLDSLFGAVELPDRSAVRKAIEPLLRQNRTIFDAYGPESDANENPEADMPTLWRAKIIETTLPNSYKMLAILDKNLRHLRVDEVETVSLFREHVHDLEHRHVGEADRPSGIRFPSLMNTLAAD